MYKALEPGTYVYTICAQMVHGVSKMDPKHENGMLTPPGPLWHRYPLGGIPRARSPLAGGVFVVREHPMTKNDENDEK